MILGHLAIQIFLILAYLWMSQLYKAAAREAVIYRAAVLKAGMDYSDLTTHLTIFSDVPIPRSTSHLTFLAMELLNQVEPASPFPSPLAMRNILGKLEDLRVHEADTEKLEAYIEGLTLILMFQENVDPHASFVQETLREYLREKTDAQQD